MPSVARSYKWFIRIDGNKEDLVERCKTMLGWIDTAKAYGMYHTGQTKENPHCHIVLELTSELQKQTIDTRLKKLFKIEKKSQYSSKVWDVARSNRGVTLHIDQCSFLLTSIITAFCLSDSLDYLLHCFLEGHLLYLEPR